MSRYRGWANVPWRCCGYHRWAKRLVQGASRVTGKLAGELIVNPTQRDLPLLIYIQFHRVQSTGLWTVSDNSRTLFQRGLTFSHNTSRNPLQSWTNWDQWLITINISFRFGNIIQRERTDELIWFIVIVWFLNTCIGAFTFSISFGYTITPLRSPGRSAWIPILASKIVIVSNLS